MKSDFLFFYLFFSSKIWQIKKKWYTIDAFISYSNKHMKKVVKKMVHKPESERSKVEKIVRDVAFFGVVLYAAVMTFLVVDAKANAVKAEADLVSSTIAAQQVAFAR